MYDFDLHMRFMRSAIDAWFGYAAAGAAALESWQEQASAGFSGPAQAPKVQPAAFDLFNPFSFWTGMATGVRGAMPSQADFAAPFFQFASSTPAYAQQSLSWPNPWGWPAAPQSSSWQSNWTEMLQACCWSWPNIPASVYQMPMTAMLVWAGFPYSVAAPAARANAASLEAADAAREGFNRIMSGFRTDGGHAFVPVQLWHKVLLLCTAPWLAALPNLQGT